MGAYIDGDYELCKELLKSDGYAPEIDGDDSWLILNELSFYSSARVNDYEMSFSLQIDTFCYEYSLLYIEKMEDYLDSIGAVFIENSYDRDIIEPNRNFDSDIVNCKDTFKKNNKIITFEHIQSPLWGQTLFVRISDN